MPDYRLYRLDGAGKIMSAEWLTAEDDSDVARLAREADAQTTVEIWDRNRLVARVQPGGGTAA